MALIGISGKSGSGKDLCGKIIQYLIWNPNELPSNVSFEHWLNNLEDENRTLNSKWKIKKFADKLKDIVCILIGCTREQLEDPEFKNKELGEEWIKYGIDGDHDFSMKDYGFVATYEEAKKMADMIGEDYQFIKKIKLTPRLLLQLLGTEAGRDIIHPNLWVNSLMTEYKSVKETLGGDGIWRKTDKDFLHFEERFIFPNFIITDVRFQNEINAIKSRKGIIIRINRPGIPLMDHPSETSLDNSKFDYTITNNSSIEDLKNQIKTILRLEKII